MAGQFRRDASTGWSGMRSREEVTVTIDGQEHAGFSLFDSTWPGTCAASGFAYLKGAQIAWGAPIGPDGKPGKKIAVLYPQQTAALSSAQQHIKAGKEVPANVLDALRSHDGPLPPQVAALLCPSSQQRKAPAPVKRAFVPDCFQEAFITAFLTGVLHILCFAGAGSGKSTVARELLRRARLQNPARVRRVLVLMFNDKNRKETDKELKKLPAATVNVNGRKIPCSTAVHTFHSYGASLISAAFPGKNSVRYQTGKSRTTPKTDIILSEQGKDICSVLGLAETPFFRSVNAATALTSKAKRKCLDGRNVDAVQALIADPLSPIDLAGADPATVAQIACQILKRSVPQPGNVQIIDFDDMVWWPAMGFAGIEVGEFDTVVGDEAQDLDECQHRILQALICKGAQAVVIGDPCQAIYGWRTGVMKDDGEQEGDGDSIRVLKARIGRDKRGLQSFPMPVNYRCGKSIVRAANDVGYGWENLQAAPDAIEGVVGTCSFSEMVARAEPGDAIISRVNNGTIEASLAFLEAGKPVRILGGGDAAKDICGAIEAVAGKQTMPIDRFLTALDRWEEKQIARLSEAQGMSLTLETLKNQCHCARLLAARDTVTIDGQVFQIRTSRDLSAVVYALVVDSDGDKGTAVNVMTGHKCKGLQFRRVFNLTPDLYPHPRATGPQIQQEYNLLGVVKTRAEQEYWEVEGMDEEAEREVLALEEAHS